MGQWAVGRVVVSMSNGDGEWHTCVCRSMYVSVWLELGTLDEENRRRQSREHRERERGKPDFRDPRKSKKNPIRCPFAERRLASVP